MPSLSCLPAQQQSGPTSTAEPSAPAPSSSTPAAEPYKRTFKSLGSEVIEQNTAFEVRRGRAAAAVRRMPSKLHRAGGTCHCHNHLLSISPHPQEPPAKDMWEGEQFEVRSVQQRAVQSVQTCAIQISEYPLSARVICSCPTAQAEHACVYPTLQALGQTMERWFLPLLVVLGLICGGIAASSYNEDADVFIKP